MLGLGKNLTEWAVSPLLLRFGTNKVFFLFVFVHCRYSAFGGESQEPESSSKPLPAMATIPKDQPALVNYFRNLSSQEEALAESYHRIARLYQEETVPPGLNRASAREMKNQYKRLAHTAEKAAAAAASIAGYHARLAELTRRLPAAARLPNPQDSAFRR
jgi:hypothetical protein